MMADGLRRQMRTGPVGGCPADRTKLLDEVVALHESHAMEPRRTRPPRCLARELSRDPDCGVVGEDDPFGIECQ